MCTKSLLGKATATSKNFMQSMSEILSLLFEVVEMIVYP